MPNICLCMRFKGTNFCGWQIQKNAMSVQQETENALYKITGEKIRLYSCGRTDSGVHAAVYAANFKTDNNSLILDKPRFIRSINAVLPQDIAVFDAKLVDIDFNARFSCLKKRYTYTVYNSAVRNPFLLETSLFYPYNFDMDAVSRAAKLFAGTHNFAAMRSLGTDVKSTVRTVYECTAEKIGNIIRINITANGFLYNMARTIVGTLIDVSRGKIRADAITEILEKGDRNAAGATAPAKGLCMTGLWYQDFSLVYDFSQGEVIK